MAAFLDPQGEHHGSLVRWAEWKSAKARSREVSIGRERLHVIDLAERFLEHYADDGRPATAAKFRGHLRRFLAVYGRLRTEELSVPALQSWAGDLRRIKPALAPKTVGHDIGAVKTMLQWGMDRELVPTLNLQAVKKPRAMAPAPVHLTREEVVNAVRKAESLDRSLACYMALNYLCLARPSETVRLVAREGRFEPVRLADGTVRPRGLFVLNRSKTEHRNGAPRVLVMSDEALRWLDSSRVRWSRLDGYSSAVCGGFGRVQPKRLQKSAGWHLQLLGERAGDIDALLGHQPSVIQRTYLRGELGLHWGLASRLTLRSGG